MLFIFNCASALAKWKIREVIKMKFTNLRLMLIVLTAGSVGGDNKVLGLDGDEKGKHQFKIKRLIKKQQGCLIIPDIPRTVVLIDDELSFTMVLK